MEYYLGVDLGTTCIKAMIVDENGKILSLSSQSNPIKRLDQKVRQDLFTLIQLIRETIDRCILESKLQTSQITLMALSSQRESFAFFDSSGVSPLFGWQDTTKPSSLNLSKKAKIATLDTLFFLHLTDKKLFVTDTTQASYAKFQDVLAQKAETVPSEYPFGCYRGIPIRVSVADHAATLYASSQPTALVLGTGAFLLNQVDEENGKNGKCADKKYLGIETGGGKVRFSEMGIPELAPILQNLVHHFSPVRTFEDLESLAAASFHSKGLFYHPQLKELKGYSTSIGLCEWTRSFVEGFTFSIKELIDAMQKNQHSLFAVLPISGGVSRSNYMMQLLSDITGIGLKRARCVDTDLLGAIKLASKNPLKKLLEYERVFQPQINTVLHDSYRLWRETFYGNL